MSDVIPLRLEMTSEGRQELDLFSVSDAIDIRLLKAMTFGENAGNIHPFTLKNRSSYHRTEWAAKALWEIDADAWELAPSDQYPRPRWRIKLNGELHRDQKVPMGESFEQKGMALTVRSFISTQMRIFAWADLSFSTLCASSRSVRNNLILRPTQRENSSWANFRSPDSVKISGLHCAPHKFSYCDTPPSNTFSPLCNFCNSYAKILIRWFDTSLSYTATTIGWTSGAVSRLLVSVL